MARDAIVSKCQSWENYGHMKREPLKVYRKPQIPLLLIPAGKHMSELVKIVETPLSKADYEQILAAKNLSSAPVDSESVAEIAELHFRLSLYAPGNERGLIFVRRGGWRNGRDGKINIKCRYVPLAGNEARLPATVTALLKQYDWSKELIVCSPAKQGAGRCLRMTGIQPASYPELVRQRFLAMQPTLNSDAVTCCWCKAIRRAMANTFVWRKMATLSGCKDCGWEGWEKCWG